jgi:SAM-dependent methyltransferase
MQNLKFDSVIDIGCGDGQFVSEFIKNGVKEVKGIEGEWILETITEPGLPWLRIADLSNEINFETKFDLAICLEVAEHLDEIYADTLVRNLVNASDVIFFSAAIPGQGGTNHVNLQYPDYWATKFSKFGYFLDWDPRSVLSGNEEVAPWYQQNCLLYKKSSSSASTFVIPKVIKHPEIFPELQSLQYKISKLPRRLLGRIKRILSGKV